MLALQEQTNATYVQGEMSSLDRKRHRLGLKLIIVTHSLNGHADREYRDHEATNERT